MSVTLIGTNPETTFSRSWWDWRPLAQYCFEVAPATCEASNHYRRWQTNDGSMTRAEALALSERLQSELDAGRTSRFAADRTRRLEATPDAPCKGCNGTGQRIMDPDEVVRQASLHEHWDLRDHPELTECAACGGLGTVRPIETLYRFSPQNVQALASFLRTCGGFEVT